MRIVSEAFGWIGSQPAAEIWGRVAEHVLYSLLVLAIAAVIGIPLGWWIGHTGKGREIAVASAGAARALPTLGLLTLLGLWLGVGIAAPTIALVVLALPSLLAGAYSGVEAVDRRVVDAARATGMTELQVMTKVEIPLGLPLLVGSTRSAMLQIIATATLAAYVGGGGLGGYIFTGLKANDYPQMLAGSVLVMGLALVSEIVFVAAGALLKRTSIGHQLA